MVTSLRNSTFLLALLYAPLNFASEEAFFGAMSDAWHGGAPWPLLDRHYPNPTLGSAYEVQSQFVLGLHDVMVGFKAGLTSLPARQRFGASEPVAGVLLESMRATGTIDVAAYSVLMIEVEIGFILSGPITAAVTDPEALRGVIESIVPVVELPDLGFEAGGVTSAVNIVAANVSARKFLLGERRSPSTDANGVRVRLLRDGVEVSAGIGTDAMADQYKALQWLINRTLETGYEIQKGQLFITGALGPMVPGQIGAYVADYEGLDDIPFEIR